MLGYHHSPALHCVVQRFQPEPHRGCSGDWPGPRYSLCPAPLTAPSQWAKRAPEGRPQPECQQQNRGLGALANLHQPPVGGWRNAEGSACGEGHVWA